MGKLTREINAQHFIVPGGNTTRGIRGVDEIRVLGVSQEIGSD